MTTDGPEVPSPTPARVWGDQWLRVNEKVLKGLNHQLTNRVAALEAVTHLFEPGETIDAQLMDTMAREVERVSTLLRLYRMLPAEPTALPEAIRVQDIVPSVLELHTYHSDLRGVACVLGEATDPEPVCVRPSALLRSLLVLLESAAGHTSRTGSGLPIVLAYDGTPTTVTISIEAPSPNANGLVRRKRKLDRCRAERTRARRRTGSRRPRFTRGAAAHQVPVDAPDVERDSPPRRDRKAGELTGGRALTDLRQTPPQSLDRLRPDL